MKKKIKKPKTKLVDHKLGQKHFIDGVECRVIHVNAGYAWVAPTTDDIEDYASARHIAYAKIDSEGKVHLI